MLAIHKTIQPVWTNLFRSILSREAAHKANEADVAPTAPEKSKQTVEQDVPRFLGIRISTLMHPAHLG